MKVTLRVPKYVPGVRPNLPDYATTQDAEVPSQNGAAQVNGVELNGVNGTRSGILPLG